MQLHLHSYGTYLHVKDQLFEIRIKADGEVKKHQYAAKKIQSIWISKGIALSSDAVYLAMLHNIDIIFLEHNGTPIGRVWHSKLGSTTLIRKRQLAASINHQALPYTQQWLGKKIDNQAEMVASLGKHRKVLREYLDGRAQQIATLNYKIQQLQAGRIDEVADQIRGLEGTAGRLYYEVLGKVIPEQYSFTGRSFRPAQDAFNAFLNYGFGILYSRVERAMILAGLDPYVGFLHRDDYNHKSMVYDFIEPFRFFVEKPIFLLFTAKKVKQDHTLDVTNGVTITKEGKVLCVQTINDYLDTQRIKFKGRLSTRINIIQSEAHRFANELIEKKDSKDFFETTEI